MVQEIAKAIPFISDLLIKADSFIGFFYKVISLKREWVE